MSACEKCWQDAYGRSLVDTSKTQTEHYHDLIFEREKTPCMPIEQKYGNKEQMSKGAMAQLLMPNHSAKLQIEVPRARQFGVTIERLRELLKELDGEISTKNQTLMTISMKLETENARLRNKLEKARTLLKEALPNITCVTIFQDQLIAAIGEFLGEDSTKEDSEEGRT